MVNVTEITFEEICDEVATQLENEFNLNGKLNKSHINNIINDVLKETSYSLSDFTKQFEELYLCDPYQYVKNLRDDKEFDDNFLNDFEIDYDENDHLMSYEAEAEFGIHIERDEEMF